MSLKVLRGVLLNYRSGAVAKELLKTVFGGKLFFSICKLNGVSFGRTTTLRKLTLRARH